MSEAATRMLRNTPRGVPSDVAYIVVVQSPGTDLSVLKGRAYKLFQVRPTKVGRLADNDVVLSDDSVSRKHCEVSHDEDGWHIRDLGSSNGTQVGVFSTDPSAGIYGLKCRPVESAKLGKYDVIQVGEFRLVFYSGNFTDAEFVKQLKAVGVTQLTDGNIMVTLE